MNAKGKFISTLFVINAAFGGYALGFNSRHVDVVDPSLPPIIEKKSLPDKKPKAREQIKTEKAKAAKEETNSNKHSHKKHAKGGKSESKNSAKNQGTTKKET